MEQPSSQKTLLAFCDTASEDRAWFSRAFPNVALAFFPQPVGQVPPADLRDAVVLSVFVQSPITGALIAQLPQLRLIAARSTGFDQIDLAACDVRGIVVSNVPHYGENTVAEFTFGLLLSLTRHIPQAVQPTRTCNFSLAGLEGTDLRGKTLGVVGAGSIGLHVIRLARGFAMDVLAFDTREARERILATTVENIHAFLAGQPINVVNDPCARASAAGTSPRLPGSPPSGRSPARAG
jgi:D-lactate dehydrogenase